MASSSGENPTDGPVLLHGDLDLWIIEARRLPNMDWFSDHLRRCFDPCISLIPTPKPSSDPGDPEGDRDRRHGAKIITTDPYVTVSVAGAVVARSRVIPNSQEPKWNEHHLVPLAHRAASVNFHVKDDDLLGAELVGSASVPASRLLAGAIREWLPLRRPNGKPPKRGAALLVALSFVPAEETPLYRIGIAGDPERRGVREAYFPLRSGGAVTLYQDAHVREGELPKIELEDGRVFEHGTCWQDMCQAILEAHHLIYIVGWSVYARVKLVREPTRPLPRVATELTLGELLKYKSEEGVRVLLLVWDDKTSHDKLFIKTGGVMQSHDEETRKFFKHSSVICVLSPRYPSNKLSIVKQKVVGTLYTHHQKCLLVDTQASGNDRKITAFIGGLDLCDGRYDTPQHRIFRDLDTVFSSDFHNPTFAADPKGPREPWHDMHCRIEGPAVYDILTNFEQRWRKATRLRERFKKASHWKDDALLKLERISWILSPSSTIPNDHPSLWVSSQEDPETWHVQVFRSIDSGSVKGFPKNSREAIEKNLICQKNLIVEKSIHTAYIKAIRSAQHFIYIENQYFIGSSYGWPSYKNAGADNLVPMELALKVASKIRAGEQFAVYVVIPLWPEGIPTSSSVQEILFWQGQTMQMMYEVIGQELKSMKLENAHPQDYLNFYCLGNREELPSDISENYDHPTENSPVALARKYRRFMIYVHAKGMIVDDEYVILGSANINQRSLAGTRDTEIAMGAYQPHYTWAEKKRHPHGQNLESRFRFLSQANSLCRYVVTLARPNRR
ncbi:phospholipase D delta-like isoform X1 [Ananas comosus]|uniref:Phospholipase D n=1 Tax=Ananas comosus TaxID=4615 RepID=A0A6P5FH38_ANACO|nr:phospholipase D delta-like isoform X2 [Ananas comosus]XP_020092535.1 phospholipase D delta-like isoform X1 [Ananas comosus]